MPDIDDADIESHGKCPKCGEQGEYIGENWFTCVMCDNVWGRSADLNAPVRIEQFSTPYGQAWAVKIADRPWEIIALKTPSGQTITNTRHIFQEVQDAKNPQR